MTSTAASSPREDDRKAPERTCVATRTVRPADELIRFVRAPDGAVTPDLKRALPGRGVWVTGSAEAVRLAVKKKAFARGFKEAVSVDPELATQVDDLLERQALSMLGFANKAGRVICGFAKVEAALRAEPVIDGQGQDLAAAIPRPTIRQQRQRQTVRPARNRDRQMGRPLERPDPGHERDEVVRPNLRRNSLAAPPGGRRLG